MLFVLAGLGCEPVCDTAALESATTGADVEAACMLPEDLSATWTCSAPLPASNEDVAGLEKIHAECGLAGLGEVEAFVTGTGDPVRAAAVYAFALANEVPEGVAAQGAALIVGPRLHEAPLPRVPGAEKVALKPATPLPAFDQAWTGWGPYPGYAHGGLEGQAFFVDLDADPRDLRYAVANLATATEPVWFTVLSDKGVTQVPLYAPGTHRAVLFSEGKVEDLLALAAAEPLALDLSFAPCGEVPEGMSCIDDRDGAATTFFIDTKGSGDLKGCRDAGACRGARGSWQAAREFCSWTGKRLPTPDEWTQAKGRLEDIGDEWTSTQHLFPEAMGYGHLNQVSPKLQTLMTEGGAKKADNVRCVSDHPWLSAFPPATVSQPLPDRGLPTEPSAELVKRAWDIEQDVLDDKGICGEDVRENWRDSLKNGGRSTTECRDPFSYVTPNEPRRYTFGPYIQNLGGGYVGVGSDQSYDFIAEAKSDWAWVFDYDPNVVRLHEVLQVLVPAAKDREDFVALFTDEEAPRARELIEDPTLEAFYNGYRHRLRDHYRRSLKPREEGAPADFGWLTNDEDFGFIQTMIRQKRIVPIGADMLKDQSLVNVGHAARDMGIPIRIYYTSNAPTAWGGQAPPEYKGNVLGLPFDEQSVVLATFNTGGFGQKGYWHQNIAWGLLVQERYAYPTVVDNYKYVWDRIPTDDPDVTIVGLPSTHPPETATKATPQGPSDSP